MSSINNNASSNNDTSDLYDPKNYDSPASLHARFSNLSFQEAGGAPSSHIPHPPPLPSQSLMRSPLNLHVRTRDWGSINKDGFSGLDRAFLQRESFGPKNVILEELRRNRNRGMPAQTLPASLPSSLPSSWTQTTTFVAAPAPAMIPTLPAGMLPAPINDGRRYARLTGQNRGSNRARRHLVQPLSASGLTVLPAGLPLESFAPVSASLPTATGHRSRRGRRAGRSPAVAPTTVSSFAQPGFIQPTTFVQPMQMQSIQPLPLQSLAAPTLKSRSDNRRLNRRAANGNFLTAPPQLLSQQPVLISQQPQFIQQPQFVSQQPQFVSQPMMKQESFVTYSQPSMVGTPIF